MTLALRAIWKLLRGVWHVLVGMWLIYVRFPQLAPEQREMRVQAWAMALLGHLGIALQVRGPVPRQGPVLLVANHLSWLDIVVIHAAGHCRFVSKSDVQGWPLIGALATAAGLRVRQPTAKAPPVGSATHTRVCSRR